MRKSGLLVVALLLFAAVWLWPRPATSPDAPALHPATTATQPALAIADIAAPDADSHERATQLPDFLPREARDTIRLIAQDGPFPHRQDGSVFGNREGHLPRKPRGYYREYTVDTPGLNHRGARRIVTGGDPPEAWYYSDDHYDSFRSFDPDRQDARR